MVDIAIIDSGINDFMKEKYKERIIGGHSYAATDKGIIKYDDYIDESNHGTSCTSYIYNKTPNCRFYLVKILGKNGKGYGKILIEALKDLMYSKIKIINMSISTECIDIKNEMEIICEELYRQGKILIASNKNNSSTYSLPAAFSNVIGVESKCFYGKDIYYFDDTRSIQCVADNMPEITEIGDNRYAFWGRNSKATAYITSKVVEIIAENNNEMSYLEICKKLKEKAETNKEYQSFLKESTFIMQTDLFRKDLDKDDLYREKVLYLESMLIRFFRLDNEEKHHLHTCFFCKQIGFSTDVCMDLIEFLVNELHVIIDYTKVSMLDFYNIDTLYYALFNKWQKKYT